MHKQQMNEVIVGGSAPDTPAMGRGPLEPNGVWGRYAGVLRQRSALAPAGCEAAPRAFLDFVRRTSKHNDKTEPQITQISQIQNFGIRRCVPDPVRPERHRNDRPLRATRAVPSTKWNRRCPACASSRTWTPPTPNLCNLCNLWFRIDVVMYNSGHQQRPAICPQKPAFGSAHGPDPGQFQTSGRALYNPKVPD